MEKTDPSWKCETTKEELVSLLREAYSRVPVRRVGKECLISFDPVGRTYEFTEDEWSKRVRKILGIKHKPSGV